MHLLEKVRLPTKVPQYEDEHQHEHIDQHGERGNMGSLLGLFQHRGEGEHRKRPQSICGCQVR